MNDTAPPRLLIVTGMSGAGKSTVLDALEDMGWDCVDNLPVDLLSGYVRGEREHRPNVPVAVGMDARSRGFDASGIAATLATIDEIETEILFLDCAPGELIRRYDATRRRHPLAPDRPAEDGIAIEHTLLSELRSAADSVLDTTDLTPAELRDELRGRFGEDRSTPVVTITSFAFSCGISRTADLVFDMRFVANPHWVEELRPLSGLDRPVRDYCAAAAGWSEMMDSTEKLLCQLIPRYWAAGKTYLTVAFGCTGGRHRSVAAAAEMADRLRDAGIPSTVRHRDLSPRPGGVDNESEAGDAGQ